jgi:hypothetical protein
MGLKRYGLVVRVVVEYSKREIVGPCDEPVLEVDASNGHLRCLNVLTIASFWWSYMSTESLYSPVMSRGSVGKN